MDAALLFLSSITLLSIVKVLLVILLLVYAIFAFLMMRQTVAMTRAISMKDDYVIRILGVAHLVFTVLVLVLAIAIL